jgi:rhodanese-related sulfurtransferase
MMDGASQNEPVVVIDVRGRAEYSSGHIPGSLNIPLSGIGQRPLPQFGRVVIVWDGVNRDAAQRGLAAFNAKPGIQAELLDGGYPAWPTSRSVGTTGVQPGGPLSVTYAELLALANSDDLVIIDLRSVAEGTALTDLRKLLPNSRIIEPSLTERAAMRIQAENKTRRGVPNRAVPQWLKHQGLGDNVMYVLVDDGDGRQTELVFQRLHVRGLTRVFVLTGGEMALRSHGLAEEITTTSGAPGDG